MSAPRKFRSQFRKTRWWAAALVCLTVQLAAPSPAQAWWGWLDNLSGPGPFNGAEFDYKILCWMDQPSRAEAVSARSSFATSEGAFFKELTALVTAAAKENNMASGGSKGPLLSPKLEELRTHLDVFGAKDINGEFKSPLLSTDLETSRETFRTIFKTTRLTSEETMWLQETQAAVETLFSMSRGARVPNKSTPRFGLWAGCSDRLRHEMKGPEGDIVHRDRRPVIALVFNYRDLRNTTFRHLFSEVGRDGAAAIHLRIFETKLSWPLSGRFDFLDGQAGAGIYRFSSDSFRAGAKSFHGLMVEPIRFDLHSPGSLIEKWAKHEDQPICNFLTRLLLSVSYSAGVVLFPGGFSADRFIGDKPGVVGREISGGEAIFEQGIVINVGRLFGL